jgi:hypothetical protein
MLPDTKNETYDNFIYNEYTTQSNFNRKTWQMSFIVIVSTYEPSTDKILYTISIIWHSEMTLSTDMNGINLKISENTAGSNRQYC